MAAPLDLRRTAAHVLFVAAPTGALVGAAIAAYDYVVNGFLWDHIQKDYSMPARALAPIIGMLATGLILRTFGVASSAMADEVVQAYHAGVGDEPKLKRVLPKLFASIATMGFGLSAGMEGASKWLGAMIAARVQRFLNVFMPFRWTEADVEMSMLAGAAAGIGAIFRAPLTGAIMGVESPFRRDLAHDALLHALVASAMSFATFSIFRPSSSYFPITFHYVIAWHDLWMCLPLGVAAGLASRLFLAMLASWKSAWKTLPGSPVAKDLAAGLLLASMAYATWAQIGDPVTLQSGLPIANRLMEGRYVLFACLAIFCAKLLATVVTFGSGGVGGLFLPSATIGAALGAMADHLLAPSVPGLFTLIGIAAFTGASYNSLLFSAVFVAEASGNPMLVVPGLLASSAAFLTSLGVSNSSAQKDERPR